jgi:hypothetical protein
MRSAHGFTSNRLPVFTDRELKVQLFQRTGNATYYLIELSINVEPPTGAHGNANIGEAIPSRRGRDKRRMRLSLRFT